MITTALAPAGGSAGLAVTGEIDLDTAPLLEQAVRASSLMDPEQGRRAFLLDMSGVTFIDSSGLYALEAISAHLDYRGWQLRLTPPTAAGPRWLFSLAASKGWLPAAAATPRS